MKKEENTKSKEQQLAEENVKLKEALELAMLKVVGLETMIEIAEESYGLEIKKKSGAKQSTTSKHTTRK